MATLSANLPSVLDPAKVEIFIDGFIGAGLTFPQWMSVSPASAKTIEKTSIQPPGGYSTRAEGNDYPTDAMREGNDVTYTMVEKVLGFSVAEFADLFLDQSAKASFVADIGLSAGRQMEADAIAVLTGGFSANGPDGVPLFSDSHPLDNAPNQDNKGTSALDYDSLRAAYLLGARLKSPDNLVAPVEYDTLVIPPDLQWLAAQLLTSTLGKTLSTDASAVDQANIAPRYVRNIIVASDFSDVSDWFLMDSRRSRFRMYLRKGPSPMQYIDIESGNWRVKDSMVYAVGHDNTWRSVFGAAVT